MASHEAGSLAPESTRGAAGARTPTARRAAVLEALGGGAAETARATRFAGASLAVGAEDESGQGTGINGDQSSSVASASSGAAYLFVRSGTSWSQRAYVKASNTRRGANFGGSVALSGTTLLVGSPSETSKATGIDADQSNATGGFVGAVYLF